MRIKTLEAKVEILETTITKLLNMILLPNEGKEGNKEDLEQFKQQIQNM